MLSLDQQILADSFETRFNPFTLEKPRVSWHCTFGIYDTMRDIR